MPLALRSMIAIARPMVNQEHVAGWDWEPIQRIQKAQAIRHSKCVFGTACRQADVSKLCPIMGCARPSFLHCRIARRDD